MWESKRRRRHARSTVINSHVSSLHLISHHTPHTHSRLDRLTTVISYQYNSRQCSLLTVLAQAQKSARINNASQTNRDTVWHAVIRRHNVMLHHFKHADSLIDWLIKAPQCPTRRSNWQASTWHDTLASRLAGRGVHVDRTALSFSSVHKQANTAQPAPCIGVCTTLGVTDSAWC